MRSTEPCPMTPLSSATSASTPKLADSVLPSQGAAIAHRFHGLRRRWALASRACSEPSWPRRRGPVSRYAEDGAFAMPLKRHHHGGGIQHPRRLGGLEQLRLRLHPGACSAAIWMAGNWPPIFRSTPPPHLTILISPPWPNRRGITGVRVNKAADLSEAVDEAVKAERPLRDRREYPGRGKIPWGAGRLGIAPVWDTGSLRLARGLFYRTDMRRGAMRTGDCPRKGEIDER